MKLPKELEFKAENFTRCKFIDPQGNYERIGDLGELDEVVALHANCLLAERLKGYELVPVKEIVLDLDYMLKKD